MGGFKPVFTHAGLPRDKEHPMIPTDFAALPLKQSMLQNLSTLGYEEMTPIQARSLPLILAGSDVIAQAKTGGGNARLFWAIRIKGRFYKA